MKRNVLVDPQENSLLQELSRHAQKASYKFQHRLSLVQLSSWLAHPLAHADAD